MRIELSYHWDKVSQYKVYLDTLILSTYSYTSSWSPVRKKAQTLQKYAATSHSCYNDACSRARDNPAIYAARY